MNQEEAVRGLVGKWEGAIERPPSKFAPKEPSEDKRTLVIEQVRERLGKWIVEKASYGITGRKLGRVDVELSTATGEVGPEFTTGAGSDVKLKLEG